MSQDQGSSNATFTNNLCLRVTGSPHNTHYGVGVLTHALAWCGDVRVRVRLRVCWLSAAT